MKEEVYGRYVAKATCPHDKGVYNCTNKEHYDDNNVHMNVIITYHIPRIGIIKVRHHSEIEADKLGQRLIYETFSKLYIEETKKLMGLENLISELKGIEQ